MHRVFVYGTLKKGQPNNVKYLVERPGSVKYLGKAKTLEKFPLVVATRFNLPFLLYAPGQGQNVVGEIYDVNDVTLKDLDILEEHPDFYHRDTIKVRLEETTQSNLDPVQECDIYFLKKFKPELLAMDFLESYANSESHPYVTAEDRPKGAEPARTFVLPTNIESATSNTL